MGLYLLPIMAMTRGPMTVNVPKYISKDTQVPERWAFLSTTSWTAVRNGADDWMVVQVNLSPANETILSAQSDVVAMPADMATKLTAADITKLTPILDDMRLPSDLLTTAISWRFFHKALRGMFLFKQRVNGIVKDTIVKTGITLDTQLKDLPAPLRQALTTAADDLKLSKGKLTATDTVRDLYKDLAQQQQVRE